MRRVILLLLAVGLIFVFAAACGGTDIYGGVVPAAGSPGDDISDADVLEDGLDEGGRENEGSGFDCEDGDALPGEGDDWDMSQEIPDFYSITGTVESVEDADGFAKVIIEDTYGNPAVLALTDDTIFLFDTDFDAGDVVTGWYRTNAPMIMIWPPQYTIKVFAAGAPDGVNIKVDRFNIWESNTDGYLLSKDGLFAFRTDENTVVSSECGDNFSSSDIDGKRIVVIYGVSTRSIPEMATADRLIVLDEAPFAPG